ncbi:hypothetical protein EDB19DRAFT_1943270 [Suillus lakei]|nr:hypothetical protein EDB19DRAFT_1943270 [Suillus lakei]
MPTEYVSEPDNGAHAVPAIPDHSGTVPTSAEARAKCRIAALEDELQTMKEERGMKQRKTTYYIAQGRAIWCMVVLYTNLEDLITENDRRYDESVVDDLVVDTTTEQDCLQHGYIAFTQTLPWLHDMMKKLKKGADVARGDDTSTLKDLIATWINQDFRPSALLRPDDKQLRRFAHDICGKLLYLAEWDWNDDRLSSVKAGIHDRTSEFIVSENSWPLFLYKNYSFNNSNLEKGLFQSKILIQAFKAIFTSSAKEANGDGNSADILESNRRTQRAVNQVKVKTCVASIISMKKVTSRSIAYVICQVCFALSNLSSWCTIDGHFDYEVFWNNIVDFFKDIPGPVAQHRVAKLLEWWTRKIFGKNHCQDLTPEVISRMSVTALAEQRRAQEDAAFDSE